jgi:hypothetical protein
MHEHRQFLHLLRFVFAFAIFMTSGFGRLFGFLARAFWIAFLISHEIMKMALCLSYGPRWLCNNTS